MRFKWMPWKYILRFVARRHGFLDPINLLSQLQRFIQPSEVNEPVELLRAGAMMHARGLINNRVIQHNLDWVWPYWIERQFDPRDVSFIPRAFSITHINLSHRNWTAVGLPDYTDLPIVDPRGLLTPFIDEWSIDVWLVTKNGRTLLPSRAKHAEQRLVCDDDLTIITDSQKNNLNMTNKASVVLENGMPVCRLDITAFADEEAWIAVMNMGSGFSIGAFILLNLYSFIRVLVLMLFEFILAFVDFFRGIIARRDLLRELQFVPTRVAISILLRELMTIGAKLDIARGLPIIHLNFLGYDEQSHRRGPSSKFAHWSLKGIDDAIGRIWRAAKSSTLREYDVWIYSDHGQQEAIPYHRRNGIMVTEAINNVFVSHFNQSTNHSLPN